MPAIEEKNETEENVENEIFDSCKSDNDEDSESGSDEDESSDLDEDEADKKRSLCVEILNELEKQFSQVKEQLYIERMAQVETKLEEVMSGKAVEYLTRLAQLNEDMKNRTHVAKVLRDYKLVNSEINFQSEKQAALQNYNSENTLLSETLQHDLNEKIRRLEEDRHNIDITSDLLNETQSHAKRKRKGTKFYYPDRRKKAITITGPYIVYMLKEMDIIDDWTIIKKALKQTEKKKRDSFQDRPLYSARYEDGKLFYESEWYQRGSHIIIDNKEDSPVHACITAINIGEVWVRHSDGNKSKLYIDQLQKGKYIINHVGHSAY